MKKAITRFLLLALIIGIGFYSYARMYAKDNTKVGDVITGDSVIGDLKTFATMDKCISAARAAVKATPAIFKTAETRKNNEYTSVTTLSDRSLKTQTCKLRDNKVSYLLVTTPAPK